MFLKKRPDQLPKAPDLKRVKSFSLFGDKPASSGAEQAPSRVRMPATAYDDVIDVEVIERPSAPEPQSVDLAQSQAPADKAEAFEAPAPVEPAAVQGPLTTPTASRAEEAAGARFGASAARPGSSRAAHEAASVASKKPSFTIKSRKPGEGLELPSEQADSTKSGVADPSVALTDAESSQASKKPAQAGIASAESAQASTPQKAVGGFFAKAFRRPASDASPPPASAAQSGIESVPTAPRKKGLFAAQREKAQAAGSPRTTEPDKETTEVGKKRSLFGRKSAADRPAQPVPEPSPVGSDQSPSTDADSAAAWWGRAQTAEKAKKPGKTQDSWLASLRKRSQRAGPQAAPQRQKSQRAQAPRGCVDLMLELENGKRVFWRVSKEDVYELEELKALTAVSFSKAELRLNTPAALSFSAAQDMALAELGEEARVVNGSRQTQAVYAITARRSTELEPVSTAPGLMLLDLALADKREDNQELLCALVLKGSDGAPRVAVLAHYNDAGELSAMQVTVNPDNLNFVLSQFAASRRLNTEDTQVVLLDNTDVLKLAPKVVAYPQEALWQGYSIRKLTWSVTWSAMAVAALCAVYAAKNYTTMSLAQSRISDVQQRERQARKALDDLLVDSTRSFAHLQSLNTGLVTERAGELWTPGAIVTVDAGISTEVYTVSMSLNRGRLQGTRPSILEQTLPDQVHPLLKRDPPEGCVKSIPELSGALNVVQITVTCESPVGALAAYRLD